MWRRVEQSLKTRQAPLAQREREWQRVASHKLHRRTGGPRHGHRVGPKTASRLGPLMRSPQCCTCPQTFPVNAGVEEGSVALTPPRCFVIAMYATDAMI